MKQLFSPGILYDNAIIKEITDALPMKKVKFYNISLIADEKTIVERLERDIEEGLRPLIVIPRSKERLKHFKNISSIHVDTKEKTKEEVLNEVLNLVK